MPVRNTNPFAAGQAGATEANARPQVNNTNPFAAGQTGATDTNARLQVNDTNPFAAGSAGATATSAKLQARDAVRSSASKYQPNVLNQFDTYTYNWAIHMISPLKAQQFEENLDNKEFITLAETGVENEISIENVIQQTQLAFAKENRNAVANSFDITFTEVLGMTFYNRIILAAKQLKLENHLEATYLLELNFRGWNQDGSAMADKEIGPFYYVTDITDFQIKHTDSATNYQVTFIETEYSAYNRMDFHLKSDISVRAATFGEFLDNFTTELNRECEKHCDTTIARMYPSIYEFGTIDETDQWRDWVFDAVTGEHIEESRNVSMSAAGNVIEFTLHKGTSMTAAVAAAVLQTKEFKKIPIVGRNQFAKANANDGIAKSTKLADMVKWFSFKTEVEYKNNYDPVAKSYQRKFIYNIQAYITPEGIHDPISFGQLTQDSELQQKRLNNILTHGLLKKRYDYTYTGLNSEVLNLDLSFNTLFFVTQPIAGGSLGTNASFPGLDTAEARSYEAKAQYVDAVNRVKSIKREIERLEGQVDLSRRSAEDFFVQQQIQDNKSQLEAAKKLVTSTEKTAQEKGAELRERTANPAELKLNPITNRYITQSDVFAGSHRERKVQNELNESMQFDYRTVGDSLAASGADTLDDPGTAMLGALELNLNATGEMVDQRLEIRGDPYWLGKPKGASISNSNQADYDVGGVGYFLNVRLPVYENEEGFMNQELTNFSITALYRVITVTSTYMMGEFKQTLESFRDTNTNNEELLDQLLEGRVIGQPTRTLKQGYQGPNPDPENDVLPNEVASQQQPDTSTTLDPNATGSGNGTITGSNNTTGSTSNIDPRLLSSMEAAAAATGLTGVISPRGGNRGPGGSGRHNGYAADISLYDGNRLLSVENPADLALIQNYTQNFLNDTRANGLTPSVGIANPNQGTGRELYMSGVVHHYDIAMTPGIGANLSSNAAPYWGGSGDTRDHSTPSWLVNMYNATN